MTDDALSHSLLVLLNEALRPVGVWLRKAENQWDRDIDLAARSCNLEEELRLFLHENDAYLLYTPTGCCSTLVSFDIDLADPLFPEKAAEWVRSALPQS